MALAKIPVDENITLAQLSDDPYPIYRRLRSDAPVLHIKAVGRTLLTKAADTKFVKAAPDLFSANDPNTPMKRAMWAHTLMRKDGMEQATDEEMQEWSQALIEGAGNFGWQDKLFERSDHANEEIHALLDKIEPQLKGSPDNSAYSLMINADDPIPKEQMYANIKIAIGGGVNEPRDALNTIIYALLSNKDQLEQVRDNNDWDKAFEEGIRWVAPIQVSSRVAKEDVEIRGHLIPKDEVVMTIQASANRDEELFEDGESFNVYRDTSNAHQAFGIGPHLCQGNKVARKAVGDVMLPILFDRFPNMEIPDDSQVIWKGFGFRGPTQIPVLLK